MINQKGFSVVLIAIIVIPTILAALILASIGIYSFINNQSANKQTIQVNKKLNQTEALIKSSQEKLITANYLAKKNDSSSTNRQEIANMVADAISDAKKATVISPENALAWNNLGLIYRALINIADGADAAAIESFESANALDPNNIEYLLNLGGVYYSQEKYNDALKYFSKVVEIDPKYANGYYNLGNTYKQLKDYKNARLNLEKAIELSPKDSPDITKVKKEIEQLK